MSSSSSSPAVTSVRLLLALLMSRRLASPNRLHKQLPTSLIPNKKTKVYDGLALELEYESRDSDGNFSKPSNQVIDIAKVSGFKEWLNV
ncbi:hypothetical protein L2E82_45897 [Cichorium intybus]|uniref:Uncharacterized protein n=1 Tax=Cichorium intybus TaxID=13427 RepID=A0ACB8ZUK1_CICIN|nr:hypothetical protein L2E82_45897 [Cichorium intybus]